MNLFLYEKYGIEVAFTTVGRNPSLHIRNSHRVKKRKDIEAALEYIRAMPEYVALKEAGYTRTPKSEYNEWRAHNVLYRLGIARERTKSVDIDQNESMLRRFVYAVLSIF